MKLGVVLLIFVGALMIYSGIYNRRFTESLGDLFSGQLKPGRGKSKDILAPAPGVKPAVNTTPTRRQGGVVSV